MTRPARRDAGDDTAAVRDLGRDAVVALQAMRDAVRIADEIAGEAAGGALTKSDASPVTIADFTVQALVAARLGRDCPDDVLVAEEDASALRADDAAGLRERVVEFVRRVDARIRPDDVPEWIDRGGGSPDGRFWTLDPIDGTKGLIRGGQFAVALALIENGVVQLGVLGCPRLTLSEPGGRGAGPAVEPPAAGIAPGAPVGGIALAVRGRGAWWSPPSGGPLVPMSVSRVDDPADARVLHSFEAQHSDQGQLQRTLGALGPGAAAVLMDSQAKHVVLASGGADLMLRFPRHADVHEVIWDQAAGAVLIQEAGGRVTDLLGRPLDFSAGRHLSRNSGIAASNGLLHDAALAAVRTATGGALTSRRAP